MRRYLGIIVTIVIVLAGLVGLSALGTVKLERPKESEWEPLRSSYNAGPTGTRAFYQLLEESGYQTARWRERFKSLESQAQGASLIIIGPFQAEPDLPTEESEALKEWIASGGRALIISRLPRMQFDDPAISAKFKPKADLLETNPDRLIDERSDLLIAQPTAITRNTRGLAVSHLAARLTFQQQITARTEPSPQAEDQQTIPGNDNDEKAGSKEATGEADDKSENDEEVWEAALNAPVVHLGDGDGAVLADFDYGAGRVIFLSDPFLVANNGIARGSNLTLALNLIEALGGRERRIFFDEYHHGYRTESNPLLAYFRGTPVPWLMGQGLLLALIIVYSAGRRFARPLPLPQVDRHSPLEFVGSMANLQQVAEARDLALENIYPRFKTKLCRALGVSVRARPEEIAAHLNRRRLKISEQELRQTLIESERALAGGTLDDHRLVMLIANMRRIAAQLK
jgi:hypothetical protein